MAASSWTYPTPRCRRPDTSRPPSDSCPTYDNVVLSHADRRRIVDDHRPPRLAAEQANVGSILVDGFVRANWRLIRDRDRTTIEIGVSEDLLGTDVDAIGAEGERLLDFLKPDDGPGDVLIRRLSTA